jgi:hypothetical protein
MPHQCSKLASDINYLKMCKCAQPHIFTAQIPVLFVDVGVKKFLTKKDTFSAWEHIGISISQDQGFVSTKNPFGGVFIFRTFMKVIYSPYGYHVIFEIRFKKLC